MSQIPDIKRFILRALLRLNGSPMPDEALTDAARNGIHPMPLKSDVDVARKQLERDGYISGDNDDLNGGPTWTLTEKGKHRAKQLE